MRERERFQVLFGEVDASSFHFFLLVVRKKQTHDDDFFSNFVRAANTTDEGTKQARLERKLELSQNDI